MAVMNQLKPLIGYSQHIKSHSEMCVDIEMDCRVRNDTMQLSEPLL